MKKIFLTALALLAVCGATAKSSKRGVSENSFMFGSQLEVLAEGSTWYYNWGPAPGTGYKNSVIESDALEFVPMAWNGSYSADKIREYCKSHPSTKYLLGFNEPNFTAQANMTPAEAAEKWPALKALADELGLKLVAPALNYSPNPPYTDPLKWMDEFVALVGLDAFDFTAIHNYGGLGVMQTLAGQFHDKYGKDVWVTEFCYWPGEGSNVAVAPSTQISSMIETVKWLESTPWIYRYAWFKATGNSNAATGPNYGLLVAPTPVTDPWQLSEQGIVYTYMSEFDVNKANPVGVNVPASDYVRGEKTMLGSGYDEACPEAKLHITEFIGGAKADYRFEVEKEGEYGFVARVGGYGEPTRFNPNLRISLVDEDGEVVKVLRETGQFDLPNSDEAFHEIGATVSLPAGSHILRLEDINPLPSGLRISAVRLSDVTAVGEIGDDDASALVDVVNLQGMVIRKAVEKAAAAEGLAPGVYIIAGKKVMVQ